jgi:hypothetical protein
MIQSELIEAATFRLTQRCAYRSFEVLAGRKTRGRKRFRMTHV